MAENRKGKDKRFYFSRAQLVMLAGAFTVASVIIFFLGMLVGKGIEARKIVKPEEPLVKIPVPPSSQGSGGASANQPKEELTFYDTLTRSPGAAPSTEERQRPVQGSEKPIPPANRGNRTKTREEAFSKTAHKNTEKAEAAKNSPPSETPERGLNGKAWTVQVNAFPDPRSAQIWVDRLKNKGYNAYSTEVLNKGKTWHRVRVGRYESREEAEKLEQTLRAKENFTKAFVTNR